MIPGREKMRYDGVGGTLATRGRWQLFYVGDGWK